MYYPIKNPQKESAISSLVLSAVLMTAELIVLTLFLLAYNWNAEAVFSKVFADVGQLFSEDFFLGIVLSLLVFSVPVWFAFSVRNFFQKRKMWRARNFVRGFDFHEDHLILVADDPVVLDYDNTALEMFIHLRMEKRGKNNYVPAVYQLSFRWNPSAPANEQEALAEGNIDLDLTDISDTNAQFVVEHKGNMDDIFPPLDFVPKLHHFSYKFKLQGTRSDLQKYRTFIDEQIQNHLQCGTHLPFGTGSLVGGFLLLLLFTGITVFASYSLYTVLTDNGGPVFAVVFGVMLCGFAGLAWSTFKQLRRYFKARSIIKRYRGN